jgi:hypothetical protein
MALAANGAIPKAYYELGSVESTRGIWHEHTASSNATTSRASSPPSWAFEYGLQPNGNNLHRVVIFRDGKDKADKVLPFSSQIAGANIDKLWDYMDPLRAGNRRARCWRSRTIRNLSNGLMFELTGPGGGPMTADYARAARARAAGRGTQIKGDSEAHPFLSPNDEFAGYGVAGWELNNLPATRPRFPDVCGRICPRGAEARPADRARTGVNPYQIRHDRIDRQPHLARHCRRHKFFGKHSGNEPKAEACPEPHGPGYG